MSELYVALVPNDDGHWPNHGEVIGIGRHCYVGSNDPVPGSYLPTPWKNDYTIKQGASKCEEEYEYFIAYITETLNKKHGIEYDKKYYDRVIGYWLIDFIHQAYDKYVSVLNASSKHPESMFLTIDIASSYVPYDFNDYQKSIIQDRYAHQIYTQIIKKLSLNHFDVNSGCKVELDTGSTSNSFFRSLKSKLKSTLFDIFNELTYRVTKFSGSEKFSVVTPYFKGAPILNYLRLIYVLKFRVYFPFHERQPKKGGGYIQSDVRRIQLLSEIERPSEFRVVLAELIEKNIPMVFVEEYLGIINHKDIKYVKDSSVVYSANAHYFDHEFMHAVSFSNKIKLVLSQHGGGYGTWKINISEWWDRKVSDVFFAWGWGEGSGSSVINNPGFSSDLRSSMYKKNTDRPQALFITNTISRYCRHIMLPAVFEERAQMHYLDRKKELVMAWSSNKDLFTLFVRMYPSDHYRWGELDRMHAMVGNNVYISNMDYNESIKEASIIILDYNVTSLLEVMSLNKPTVLLCDEVVLSVRASAQPYFSDLAAAGIMYSNVHDMISHIENISDNIDAWWCSDSVQRIRKKFVNKYAKTTKSDLGVDLGENLKRLLDK